MPKNHLLDVPDGESAGEHGEPLLGSSNELDSSAGAPGPPSRHPSSITRPPAQGLRRTPRTSNRVRFDIEERKRSSSDHEPRDEAPNGEDDDDEDEDDDEDDADRFSHPSSGRSRGTHTAQRAPLLTGIEAPSVTVANSDLSSEAEDWLENPRPKSGMMSAFMNMANSIM